MDPFGILAAIISTVIGAAVSSATDDPEVPEPKPKKPQFIEPEHKRLSASGGSMPMDTGSSVSNASQNPNDVRLTAIETMKRKLGV